MVNGRFLLAICLLFAALATVFSASRFGKVEFDGLYYNRVVASMHAGEGYYQASAEQMQQPASRASSFRTPVVALVLRYLPQWSWYLLDFAAWAVALWLLASTARRPQVTVLFVGAWALAMSSYGVAHFHELYGLPFAVAGLVAYRRQRWGWAAGLFLVATCIRELYGVGLILGVIFAARRRPFIMATVTAAGLWVLHAHLAHPWLVAHGQEAPFGRLPLLLHARGLGSAISWVLYTLGPGHSALSMALVLVVYPLALWTLLRSRRWFEAGYIALLAAAVAYGLRPYWLFAVGLVVAAAAVEAPAPRWATRARLAWAR